MHLLVWGLRVKLGMKRGFNGGSMDFGRVDMDNWGEIRMVFFRVYGEKGKGNLANADTRSVRE